MVYQEAYNKFVVYNDDFHDIAADLITSLKGRTVIFVERKDHGLEIMKRIPGAIWVSGDDKKDFRKDTIQKLKESPEDTPVISTRIFKTGVDIYVHNVVNLSAMAAEHGVIQGFGRGLRLAPDKDHCDYHDFILEQNTHLLKHSKRRIAALKKEGHNITILDDYA
jgi:superfamily II DNA or RNA helicase